MNQTSIFDLMYEKYKITKPIRLIEFFAGYGSQALALKYLGVEFEHWKICEWAVKSIQAYKDIHFTDDDTDYSKELAKEQLQEYLFNKGISSNYNEPMTKQQIDRLSEEQLRTIYNNIKATKNLVNIQQVKGKDLEIVDTDKYEYILTYSFPCQDLSLAGKGKGMSDTSTRSGMLWEVERIISELDEKPQILLMENVPMVHSGDNINDFQKWINRLEELGYKNYFQDLIATDYGIPQTRNRCFMISILGDYSYTFPKPIPLKLKLKDMLEDNAEEKYYLSDKTLEQISNWKSYQNPLDSVMGNESISPTITTRIAESQDGGINASMKVYCDKLQETTNILKIKNATKKGYLEATDGDEVDISGRMEYHRGTVQKGKTQTLSTMGGENNGVVVVGNYTPSNHNASRVVDQNYSAPTVTENHGTVTAIVDDMYSESKRQLFTEDGNIKRYMDSDIVDEFKEGQMATTTYPNGYGHGPRTHDNSVALNTIDKPSVKHNLRIRKLTPKECFRLMGVKDEDFEKIKVNQSDSSLYHLAGDSIVVNVLMAIFKELL